MHAHSVARHARAWAVSAMAAAAVACPMHADAQVTAVAAWVDAEPVATRVAPSVVHVAATAYATTSDSGQLTLQRAVGAGTVVAPGGFIATSAHLVANAIQVDVVTSAGADADQASRTLPATLVGMVADLDLAILRVEAGWLPALTMARTPIETGAQAITVVPGSPATCVPLEGAVVATGVPIREDAPVPYLVTDAPQGVAGAPIVNARGELVGLAAAFADTGDPQDATTAALPVALLEAALAEVLSPVPVERGVVGIAAHRVVVPSPDQQSAEARLVVSGVMPSGPADLAGIRVGDVVRAVNGRPIAGMDLGALYVALYALRAGQTLHLVVERDGQLLDTAPTAVSLRSVNALQ